MPIYTYRCQSCSEVTEKRQSFSDAPLTDCESCGGALRKVIQPVGIVFKGSGWYVTDSRTSGKKEGVADTGKSADNGEKKVEAPATTSENGSSKAEGTGEKAKEKSESSAPAAAPVAATTPAPSTSAPSKRE